MRTRLARVEPSHRNNCMVVGSDGAVVTTGLDALGLRRKPLVVDGAHALYDGITVDPLASSMSVRSPRPGEAGHRATVLPNGTELTLFLKAGLEFYARFAIDSDGELLTSSSGHQEEFSGRTQTSGVREHSR
jgi:hypothetical protein